MTLKIINSPISSYQAQIQDVTSHPKGIRSYRPIWKEQPVYRDELLTKEITTMMADLGGIGYKAWHDYLPVEKKESLVALLQEAASLSAQHYQHEQTKKWLRTATFHPFTRLPIEIRCQIWSYDLAPYEKPRIHAIDECNWRWISNQPTSILLQICQESRNFFLSRTKTSFAFGTYFNFDKDIIFPLSIECVEEELPSLLQSEGISKVKKMALYKELFYDIRVWGEGEFVTWKYLKDRMPALQETPVIFADDRSTEETWEDIGIELKKLSVNQRKTVGEYKFVLSYSYLLDEVLALQHRTLQHPFVVINPKTSMFLPQPPT